MWGGVMGVRGGEGVWGKRGGGEHKVRNPVNR